MDLESFLESIILIGLIYLWFYNSNKIVDVKFYDNKLEKQEIKREIKKEKIIPIKIETCSSSSDSDSDGIFG